MRLIVIRLGAFGDIVHTLPMAARCAAAGMEIEWLCEDRWASLLTDNPIIHRVHHFPRRAFKDASIFGKVGVWRDLRRLIAERQADAVIDAHGLFKSAVVTWGNGRTVGHAKPRAREGAWLAYRHRCPTTATHVIDQQCDLGDCALRQLNVAVPASSPWEFPLPVWPEENAWAHAWLAERQLDQPWILECWRRLADQSLAGSQSDRLCQRARAAGHHVIVLWGSPAEAAVADAIVAAVPGVIKTPTTTIPQAGALMRQAGLVVSGDTGPLHPLFAVGCPCIGLFGPVPAERNGPARPRHRHLPSASRCLGTQARRRRAHGPDSCC